MSCERMIAFLAALNYVDGIDQRYALPVFSLRVSSK